MIELLFVRHGPTEWNEARRIQGRRDLPLSTRGAALLAGGRLPAGFGERCRWISSPLRRARETARALGANERALEIEPRLAEMDWGEWEGRTLPELRRSLGESMRANEARGLDFETPAGDSPRRVRERLRSWLSEVGAAGRPVAAISHKGVGRALLSLAIGWDLEDRAPIRLRWEHAHRFEVSRGGVPRLVEPNLALALRNDGPGAPVPPVPPVP